MQWRRVLTKGKKEQRQSGHGLVCAIARGYVSIWPLTGEVTRRLDVAPEDVLVLIPAQALVDELDRCLEERPS